MNKIKAWIKSSKCDFALFIILLVLANIVGHNAFFRMDFTGSKSYSLSKASKQLVKTVSEPVTVRVFFNDNLPAPYNTYAQYVKDLLEEYEGAANKNFNLIFMDMEKAENRALASDFGLGQVQIQEIKNNEVGFKQVYMGIVISYGDSVELLDGITSIDGLEYKITSALSRMIDKSDALSGLGKDEKLDLTLYLSDDLINFGISGIDQVEALVRAVVAEVNQQNKGRIAFKTISPSSQEAEELAEKYGIQAITYQNGTAAIGLVLEYKDKFRILPLYIERSMFGYSIAGSEDFRIDINDAISGILSKSLTVGYVTGHNELDLNSENYCANFNALLSRTYDIVTLDLSNQDIPAGMNCLIINGPQYDFSEEELYKIDQFVMKGGNLMVYIDPLATIPSTTGYSQYDYIANDNNIDRLLEKYGIKRNSEMIMDESCYVQSSQTNGSYNLYWAPMLQKTELAKHPVTNNLGYVIMLQMGSFELNAPDGIKATVLAKSTEKAWTEGPGLILNPMLLTPNKAEEKSYDMAVLLEGKFESAFDAAPETNSVNGDAGNGINTDSHLSKGKLAGKIFFASSSALTTRQVVDADGTNPVAMMTLNMVDYLNGREELCSMRTKGLNISALTLKSKSAQKFAQYFNIIGIVVLVALFGLIVYRKRSRRRVAIQKKYNPNDDRFMTSKKEAKKEEKNEAKDENKGADNE
ncbi:MAG: Gldg family protein [Treponema sp.]|nr:Gldg family protein [Treponema sp.]